MPAALLPPMAVMLPPVISMVPAPLPSLEPMPAAPLPPVAVRLPVSLPSASFSDVMVSLPVVPVLSSLCSRPAWRRSLIRVLLPLSVIFVSPSPSTLRAASFLAVMLTLSSVTLRVLSLPASLLMMRMTFWAAALKLSAAVFKTVVDSVGVPSSSLALVYIIWLPGAELSPGWGSFSSPPVVVLSGLVSFFSPPVMSSEPEVPSPEPVLSGSELPAPVFSPGWVWFSSPPSEESLPLGSALVPSGETLSSSWLSLSSDGSAVKLDLAAGVAVVPPSEELPPEEPPVVEPVPEEPVPGSGFLVMSVPVPPLMVTLPSSSLSPRLSAS